MAVLSSSIIRSVSYSMLGVVAAARNGADSLIGYLLYIFPVSRDDRSS